jgi:hypothetical protein
VPAGTEVVLSHVTDPPFPVVPHFALVAPHLLVEVPGHTHAAPHLVDEVPDMVALAAHVLFAANRRKLVALSVVLPWNHR